MAMNVTPFVGTDNFNMETFNNMISQINSGVNSEISDVLAQLGTKAKIQTGSYVGTGTYGADNPCSLTFDFVPRFFMILGYSSNFFMYEAEGSGTDMACFDKIGNAYPSVNNRSVDSNGFGYHTKIGTVGEQSFYASRAKLVNRTFSWFTQGYDEETESYLGVADKQYNALNYTYYWIAIG